MDGRHILLLLLLISPIIPAYAIDHIWMIGGGASLHSSQAQIELNVKWEFHRFRHNDLFFSKVTVFDYKYSNTDILFPLATQPHWYKNRQF